VTRTGAPVPGGSYRDPAKFWPAHGDVAGAWASADPDGGPEWITVGFGAAVDASAVVVLETHLPGAVARIDDVTDPAAATALWEGTTEARDGSRALRIDLPAPRRIGRLRVVLDTRRVEGWNEIDAIGPVP